jgi:TolB-like protein/tetratricopeptide (TPR) repeat protein/predicted Ser/Thr protein kinase
MMVIGQDRFDELPDDVMFRVNRACNQFEQLWRTGEQTNVEEMLDDVDTVLRDAFVHELVPLEIEYRRRAELDVLLGDYVVRFPNVDEMWLAALLDDLPEETVSSKGETRVISHYGLQRLLGIGGMGKVYLAHDTALGRECALKVLANRFSPSLRARWVREARTCARLQHPCIASFYESGEDCGESFIAMEFVKGQSLRQRLAQGPLLVEEAMNLTASLLEALGHAHAVGILHRDIKPENIMLTNLGRVKLLDFGLAKDLKNARDEEDQTVTMLTGVGGIVGTVGYMSPEQLRGETLDERADVFSVGAVLYEAVTGRPAFSGSTATERIAMILSKDPEPIGGTEILDELNTIVRKSLSRDAGRRYPSAAALMSDLRRVGSGELRSGLPESLIVFDFTNLAGNLEDDWIGVGVAETLCASLSNVPNLDVMPRERLLRAQASTPETDPQSLGLKLGGRWSVVGSYQKMGTVLRFTVRLIELLTGETAMTGQVDGTCEEIFDLQDQLTILVKDRVGHAEVHTPPPAKPRPRSSAYECYVKGRQAWISSDKRKLEQAHQWFERGVEVDPNYAPILAGMAAAHALRFTFTTDSAVLDTAEEYAHRAIDADPQLSDPHVWLGYIQFHRGAVESAYEEEQRAINLDPENPQPYYFAACFGYCDLARECQLLSDSTSMSDPHQYRREKVLQLLQRGLEVYKLQGWPWLGASVIHLDLGNFAESRWCVEQVIGLEAKALDMRAIAEGFLGEFFRRTGDFDAARVHCLIGIKALDDSDNLYNDTYRSVTLCTLGKTALAQGDLVAARSAFTQAVLHSRGRNRARAIGHPFVHALCGLAETDQDEGSFREAISLFRDRAGSDFAWFWNCSDDGTLLALARGAAAVGQTNLARQLHTEAIDCGSTEAPHVQIS